jgi:streptogramin lyase
MKYCLLLLLMLALAPAWGATLLVKNSAGDPLPIAMVTRTPQELPVADLSDDGYTPDGVTNTAATVVTRFTDADGKVSFEDTEQPARFRIRAQGYVDAYLTELPQELALQTMTEEQLFASYPSNVWLSQLRFGGDEELKNSFELNCAFCHQQASPFMRNERTPEQWLSVIQRMNTYGARLPADDAEKISQLLPQEYRELREHPQTVPAPRPWGKYLSSIEMTEWPLGDGFSQMHDFLLHPNGFIYIGDNLFDRIYELDPTTGQYTVYKVPHDPDMGLGGIMGNRFEVFPKMYNYMGVHSFAFSKKDGNIFITPSMQQALLEFDIKSKKFITHHMPEGFYPHTIRVDAQDRVWFTLALSSQVAMFDRSTKEFTVYDLPARSTKEWLILKSLPLLFKIDAKNRPTPAPTRESIGLPMPYGIDIAPDGTVWVARLYANDLARIDPETQEVTIIDFPFNGPRRLRVDAEGTLWIVAFQDSLLVSYDPQSNVFKEYSLPVINEIPYALNVDRDRGVVWVNGNQSDTILAFDIATESWKVYPLPRQRFFTRDIEISEQDGAIYTTNSHFPTWQSEGGEPTLLRITPLAP